MLQAKLGARRAATFDVNCACAAWVTALDVAARRIATDPACGLALVVGAYGMTRFLDRSDKHTATLFADGAGAVLLEAGAEPGFLAGRLGADGSWHDALGVYTGGAARPATEEAVRHGGPPHVEFARRIPAGFNTEHWPPLVRQVVADAGLRLGEVGELVLKGPSMFSGYFEDPAASAEAVDAGGWFHTGDLAYADGDGFYFIVDRKKDMFVSGGENVYPAEVERALCEHPAVLMCAVVGVPDERWGEVGRAFVVRRDGATSDEEELLAFLRTRLARYKQPRSLRFVPELPISPQGKVLKRLLRAP